MRQFTVTDNSLPRLDRAIQQHFPSLSTGKLHKYLRENKIKTDGKRLPLSARLPCGSTVCIYLPDDMLIAPAGPLFLRARKNISIVYEDKNIMIIDKDAGLPVMDENGLIADTLINRVLLYLYDKGEYIPEKNPAPRLCHRLDTGTSGLVLIAKNRESEQFLTLLIKNRKIRKQYLCVTFGRPDPAEATLHGWLVKNASRGHVQVFSSPSHNAKEIITEYKTLAVSGRLALLEVELITGRTHQIRAHLASIGCPVLGDSKYGNNSANRELKLKYQALCAYCLKFPIIHDGPCTEVSGKSFHAARPWYCEQILNKTLR